MTFYKQEKRSHQNESIKECVCTECGGTELRWNYPQKEAVCSCCGNPLNHWKNNKKSHEETIQTKYDVVEITPIHRM